ncbi:MAG: helix-turn-helix domain-containing protein [Ruminococcaceae bacterium]|nr:helix-turn-helix domain-containing protein [Oscillospiraceae bacterium]
MEIERWISSKEVAEYLGINKDTLQRWITNRSIPCHRVGRLWKFRISEIDNWVQSGSAANIDKTEEE